MHIVVWRTISASVFMAKLIEESFFQLEVISNFNRDYNWIFRQALTKSSTIETFFNTTLGVSSCSNDSPLNGRKAKEHYLERSKWSYWVDSTRIMRWIHSSHRKHQIFVVNCVAETLEATSESAHCKWQAGLACLKQPESEWPEQLNPVLPQMKNT